MCHRLLSCALALALLSCATPAPTPPPALRDDFGRPAPRIGAFLTISEHRCARGDRAGALAAATAATRRDPTSGAAQLARATLLAGSPEPEAQQEAAALLADVVRVRPDAPGLARAEGTLALAEGRPDDAWEHVEPALGPGASAALQALAVETLVARGQEEEAIRVADALLELHPGDPRGLAGRASAHQRLGDDAAAVRDARRALRARQDDAALRLLLVRSLLRTGNVRDAESRLSGLDADERTARSERLAAEIALASGDRAAAEAAYRRALERAPGDPEIQREWAELELSTGDAEAALALVAGDTGPDTAALRARALAATNRNEEAAQALREAVTADPDLLEPWTLLAGLAPADGAPLDRAAAVWPAEGSRAGTELIAALVATAPERQAGHYDAALAAQPGLALAANNRASLLLDAGEAPERALALAEAAHTATRGNPIVAETLGHALLVAARPEDAAAVLGRGLAAAEPATDAGQRLRARLAEAHAALEPAEPAGELTPADEADANSDGEPSE